MLSSSSGLLGGRSVFISSVELCSVTLGECGATSILVDD
jgi:hypothetical protein